jgi:hypothetical protein
MERMSMAAAHFKTQFINQIHNINNERKRI